MKKILILGVLTGMIIVPGGSVASSNVIVQVSPIVAYNSTTPAYMEIRHRYYGPRDHYYPRHRYYVDRHYYPQYYYYPHYHGGYYHYNYIYPHYRRPYGSYY